MVKYLKHQSSLKRKRESKKRSKETPVDFVTLCTGASGSGAPPSECGDVNPDVEIATSASSQDRAQIMDMVATSVSELGSNLNTELNSSLQDKFSSLVTMF